ncbi:hypothetical protein T03_10674 [Trichinella britovi]|uniref:Uncharacterized protein n=1 Tax=Trichinella britovi TaxID=45882 RepID=A0A0V1C455_TRIBR|nr:hypothetical protein T03_10674 [Trichinella britovi]
MQIKIAIKVPYRQLECTRSFDLRGKRIPYFSFC